MVRGTVVLPNGTGKSVKVLVLTRGPKEQEAKDAGADFVGADEFLAGGIEYRVDKAGIIHAPVGKRSFGPEKLEENVRALYKELLRVRPAAVKGTYVKSAYLSATMSPAINIDAGSLT